MKADRNLQLFPYSHSIDYSSSSSNASASFSVRPFPVTRQVIAWSNNPGGPIKLHTNNKSFHKDIL